MAGQKDKVTEYQYTVQLYDKIISPSKKIHTFPDGMHQVFEDYEADEFVGVVCDWVNYKQRSYKLPQPSSPL
jgi:alpha-beta hydrolase superfamily lysophospholipase